MSDAQAPAGFVAVGARVELFVIQRDDIRHDSQAEQVVIEDLGVFGITVRIRYRNRLPDPHYPRFLWGDTRERICFFPWPQVVRIEPDTQEYEW